MIALLRGRETKRPIRFGIASFAHLYLCCAMAAHGAERATMPILPRHSVLGAAVSDTGSGLKILSIAARSPAEQAGLQVGDIVSEVGHEPVGSPLEFTLRVRRSPANTPLSFQVLRAGRSLLLPVVLAVAPDESDPKVLTEYRTVRVDGTSRRTLLICDWRTTSAIVASRSCALKKAASATAKDRRVRALISNPR
jgi:membrane-associated protease RseP (regulator of RpoE activity)